MKLFLLLFILGFNFFSGMAQRKGVLPFNNITYTRNGIWGKDIEVTLDKEVLISNEVKYGAILEIKLLKPTGFLKNVKGVFFAGIKLLVLNAKKDTIVYRKNLFEAYEKKGFTEGNLKSLDCTISLDSNLVVGTDVTHFITFYDLKSKNKLDLKFDTKMHGAHKQASTSDNIATANGSIGYNAIACGGVRFKKFEFYLDSIFYPNNLYQAIRIAELDGLSLNEVKEGSFETITYDKNWNIIKNFNDGKHYVAETFKDKSVINILVQIPLLPNNIENKNYGFRYIWKSKDNKKRIDLIYKATN